MGVLNIKLNQDYKSFSNGFETTLEGDLVVISGVNGSGKSQLMEIIKGYQPNNPNLDISSDISINGSKISGKNILYRSFRENILNVSSIGNSNPQNILNHKQQVWSNYTNGILLNSENRNLRNYHQSSQKAKQYLIDYYGEDKFNRGELTQQNIIDAIKNDFIWSTDDIFSTNTIADLFFVYASKKYDMVVSNSKLGINYNSINFETEIGIAPWKKLNILLETLGIDYRFKDEYEITGSFLNEQPRLYAFEGGILNTANFREVNDLSDGEKIIISLIFSSLSNINSNDISLILLDEFDATFNPSLTEIFYKVIDEYFVQEGIMAIIVTHSTTTISLAPANTIFYEVRKKSDIAYPRIEKVEQEKYEELKIAHSKFYNEKQFLENQLHILQIESNQTNKNLIITEGKTDWKHLKIALGKFKENGEFLEINDIEFLEYSDDMGHEVLLNYCIAESKKQHSKNVICIFDRDDDKIVNKVDNKSWGNNVHSFCIPEVANRDFEKICIEHYYSDDDLKKSLSERRLFLGTEFHKSGNSKDSQYQTPQKNKCDLNTIIDDRVYLSSDISHLKNIALPKDDFIEIVKGLDISSFENFRRLFEKIKSISNPT